MKKVLSLILTLCLLATIAAVPALAEAPKEVLFWHSMSSNAAAVMDEIVADYNATRGAQNGYKVTSLFAGAYQESSVKLTAITSTGSNAELPDLYQISARGCFEMKDNEYLIPIADMLDKDPTGLDLANISAASLQYASYEGKLLGFPFANSSVIMYYNKDHFKEAGLDPDAFPKTLAELADTVSKLTKKQGDKIDRFGLGVRMRFFLLGSLIPMQGEGLYAFDNMNGHNGTPTQISMTKDGSLARFMDEWQKVLATGGVDPDNMSPNADFVGGMYSIIAASSAGLANMIKQSQEAGFEFGVAELCRVDENSTTGTGLGGSGLYMFDNGKGTSEGAWDFIKYFSTPEVSAKWMMGTGYYPVNKLAYDLPEVKALMESNPQWQILKTVANNSENYPDYLEPWVAGLNEMDTMVGNELVAFAQGQSKEDTIARIDEQATELLQDWADQN